MLTLMLAAALALPQDGGAAATDTSDTVLAFLESAEENLYDPREHGLESLEFVVPMIVPVGAEPAEVAAVSVSWTLGQEPAITGKRADPMPSAVAGMPPQFLDQLVGNPTPYGAQYLGYALADYFGPLLQTHVATLGAGDDGVTVEFTPKADAAPGQPATTWTFDEDGVPTGFVTQVEQQGPMGAVTIDFESTYNYRTGPAGKLVLESVSMSQMVGGSPMVETNTVMTYAERGEILVLTDVVTNATMMGVADPIRSPLAFRDIVANGEPVTRAAAAPAAGEGR